MANQCKESATESYIPVLWHIWFIERKKMLVVGGGVAINVSIKLKTVAETNKPSLCVITQRLQLVFQQYDLNGVECF